MNCKSIIKNGKNSGKVAMKRENRFDALKFPDEPTDYEEFEDVLPYNSLVNGNWKSLPSHPNSRIIKNRFGPWYSGKLLWKELDAMKKKIEKRRSVLEKYLESTGERRFALCKTIRETTDLCNEGFQDHIFRLDTVLLSTISSTCLEEAPLLNFVDQVDDDIIMMHILSFIEPKETCSQKLQKHLDVCKGSDGTGRSKCTKKFVTYDCENGENGRCSHYYEIENAKEDLEYIECIEHEQNIEIAELESEYQLALAKKENRLREYLYDDDY
jgi:hypothetical protein